MFARSSAWLTHPWLPHSQLHVSVCECRLHAEGMERLDCRLGRTTKYITPVRGRWPRPHRRPHRRRGRQQTGRRGSSGCPRLCSTRRRLRCVSDDERRIGQAYSSAHAAPASGWWCHRPGRPTGRCHRHRPLRAGSAIGARSDRRTGSGLEVVLARVVVVLVLVACAGPSASATWSSDEP